MEMIVMKRGGQPGKVAINPALVTEVRSSAGPFTDVYFGSHYVSVEGNFDHVVMTLQGKIDTLPPSPAWNARPKPAGGW